MEGGRLVNGFLPRLPNECLKGRTAAKWSVCVLREHDGTALLYGYDTEMTPCCNDKEGLCDTESNTTRLPDDKSQIIRLNVFGLSGLKDYTECFFRSVARFGRWHFESSIGLHGQKVAAVPAQLPMELSEMSSSKP